MAFRLSLLPALLALGLVSCCGPPPAIAPSTAVDPPAWSRLHAPGDQEQALQVLGPTHDRDRFSCRAICDAQTSMAVPYLEAETGRMPAGADGHSTATRRDVALRQADPGVSLEASATRLQIRLDRPLHSSSPLDDLLVRWWLNHQPVQPSSSASFGSGDGGLLVRTTHLDITVTRMLESLGAHRGDVIGVQILLCPAGCSPAAGMAPGRAQPAGVDLRPRMSRVVEFRVDGPGPVGP